MVNSKINQHALQQEETMSLETRLIEGLQALDVSHGDKAIKLLLQYLELLSEWNKTHNLTAVDDIDQMLSVHVFDSASIRPYLKGPRLLDVGSGAGLPGMVLAILSPALEVVSVEARNKKAQFQTYASNQLGLKNFTVENSRIEDYQPDEPFQMITARAFSSLELLVECSEHALSKNGKWYAMKGVDPIDEIKALSKNYICDTFSLNVPELDAERNLVVIERKKK